MYSSIKYVAVAWMLLAVFASGCSRQEDAVTGKKTTVTAAEPVSTRHGAVQAGSVTVTLLPDSPTSRDAMQAQVHGGSGTYQFSWERNGELLDGQTSSNLAGQSFVKGDTVTVVVMTESGEVRTSKTVGNSPPGVTSVAFVDPFVHRGVDLVAAPDGFDLDGDPVEYHYQWSINGEEVLGNDTPTLAGDQFRKGDRIDLTISPFDAEGEGRPFRGVEFTIPNAPPSFVTTPPETFKGTQYSYKPVAQDPDDDSVTYQLESAPEGMAIDPQSGQIEWAIGTEQMGEHRIRIVARDDEGTQAVQEYILTLAISESLNQ